MRRHDSAALIFSHLRRGMGVMCGLAGSSPSSVAQAIATAEGYGVSGAIPTKANNPGDLKLGDQGYGTINGITVFPSASAGWSALESQIGLISSGKSQAGYSTDMSISQVGQLYSGGDSNWAKNVAAALGVSTDTTFSSVASGSPVQTASTASTPSVAVDDGTDSFDLSSMLSEVPGGASTAVLTAAGIGVGLALLAFS